jgi:hypothetical protein
LPVEGKEGDRRLALDQRDRDGDDGRLGLDLSVAESRAGVSGS